MIRGRGSTRLMLRLAATCRMTMARACSISRNACCANCSRSRARSRKMRWLSVIWSCSVRSRARNWSGERAPRSLPRRCCSSRQRCCSLCTSSFSLVRRRSISWRTWLKAVETRWISGTSTTPIRAAGGGVPGGSGAGACCGAGRCCCTGCAGRCPCCCPWGCPGTNQPGWFCAAAIMGKASKAARTRRIMGQSSRF